MPANFVQSKLTRQTASATTTTATFDSNVTARNLIRVMASWDGGLGVLSGIADSLGNTYTAVDNLSDGGNPNHYATWYAKDIAGGACTVTVTYTSARPITLLHVEEISGVDTTAPLDQHGLNLQAAPGTGANGVTSGSETTTTDGQWVSGCSMATGSSTINYTGGTAVGLTTTVRNNVGTSVSDRAVIAQSGAQTTAGATEVRATSDNNQPVVTGILTFKAVAGPTVTSVSTGTPREGASLTITGTAFGASQGGGGVTINGVAQTVTSWADTSVAVTVVLGTNKFGAAYNVILTDSSAVPSNTYAGITGLLPANSGLSSIDVGTPHADPDLRLESSADAASGDQVEWENKGLLVDVFANLTFSAGPGVNNFRWRIWTSGSGYGDWMTQRTGGASGAQRLGLKIGTGL